MTLALDPQQPFVRILPATYFASKIYVFKPMNDVCQKRFTLVQELVLEATVEAMAALCGKDTLAMTGALQYQGCDDKVCYNPTSVLLL